MANYILNELSKKINVDDIAMLIFEYTIVYSKCDKYNEKSIKIMSYLKENKSIRIENKYSKIEITKPKHLNYLRVLYSGMRINKKKSDINIEFFIFLLKNRRSLYAYMDYEPSVLYLGCCGVNKKTYLVCRRLFGEKSECELSDFISRF
jgi:hypothetical protein